MKQVFTIAKQIADIVGRIIVGIFVVIVGVLYCPINSAAPRTP